ncbi:apolipoprotein N-acyltransferase [Saccharopolyspora subtropica]|uniref:Apolipoprotein N-acyltransferase n=1 Tax=Saccharopolyspora thermophila TaxID=89367 RepID=A0A917K2F9_9PSEU|nr:apolipoprotein N-acyltransferase [Saccharopolyspora subtropica]GGI96189.1 apolipoprotein N-acyltransferase [Saccharopolyspora subtropica]
MVVPTARPQRRAQRGGSAARILPTGAGWYRAFAVVAAGFGLYAGSPPRELWWLAPIAFAVFAAVVRGRSARAGFGYGLLFGFAYLLPLLGWLQDFLGADFGPWPWLGVAAVEALFVGLAGAGMARVSRLPGAPVWMAAVFVTAEIARSAVPFGGFPWGRLAFTQDTGALLSLASIGGAVAVSFAVALTGAGLAELAHRARTPRGWIAPAAAVLVPVLAGLVAWPFVGTDAQAGTARVAIVQGNAPNIGLGLLYEDDVLHDNHIAAADRLADDVAAGRVPRPDFVVLPEQVGSWGPDRADPDLSAVAARLGVPLVVGGLGQDADGELHNLVLKWDPATGAGAEYVKQHLVPFAETIPMRPIARLVSPFVDRFRQDMVPGDQPGVLDVGGVRLGVGICYDVSYDDVFTGATQWGATLLAVPTNNAWYGHSEMSYQQLAMSRLRAVEHGRAVLVAATSGVSAVVQPDGSVTRQSELFTAQTLVAEVPLRTDQTIATRLGSAPTWTVVLLGVGAVAASWWRPRRAAHA